jgi:hypothetical protein
MNQLFANLPKGENSPKTFAKSESLPLGDLQVSVQNKNHKWCAENTLKIKKHHQKQL